MHYAADLLAGKFVERIKSDRGAVLIIVAAVAMGVIAVLFILGINSVRIQRATQELRFVTDEICASVASDPLVQSRAAQNFGSQINTMVQTGRVPYLTNVAARVTIPTMPGTQLGEINIDNPIDECECADGICVDTKLPIPFLSDQDPKITELPISTCTVAGLSCIFEGDSCNTRQTHSSSARYPQSAIINSSGAGSTVGCEVTAIVPSIVPLFGIGNQSIVARVVWERSLRTNLVPPQNPMIANVPGLTIAISTYLQVPPNTAPNAPVFSFGGAAYPKNFQALVDPVLAQTSTATPNFSWKRPPGTSANKQLYPWTAAETLQRTIPGYPSITDQNRDDILQACLNPAVLVRNLFVATIVELASRHGELRNRTEILHPNPVTGLESNPPVQMVRFGQDLTALNPSAGIGYQLPYLYYQASAPFTAGALQVLTPNETDIVAQTRAFLASQLRICYGLYQGAAGPANLLNRFGSTAAGKTTLETAFGQLLANNLSMPLENDLDSTSPYARPPNLFQSNGNFLQDGHPWDQKCPWGANGQPFCSLDPVDFSRPLRATELVSILGSSQLCPYKSANYPDYNLYNLEGNPNCTSNLPAWTSDLRPDWLSTLGYIGGVVTGANNALVSPGMFAVVGIPGTNGQTPFGPNGDTGDPANVYRTATSLSTAVLLVLHRPPFNQDEAEAIKGRLIAAGLQGGLGNRTVTVAYFPTNLADSLPAALTLIQDAFNIDPTITDSDPTQNALFVFSPNSQKYADGTNTGTDLPTFVCPTWDATEGCFGAYWQYMLGEATNKQENIVDAAANVFLARFLRKQRKL